MKKTTVDEVLQQGIYGPLETKPDERRKFLGTLRERIVVALTKSQVAETSVYPKVEKEMKERPQSHLFLNGNMSYETLSKYVKLATKYKIEHTLVTNKEHDSEIGLVLAMDYAIDQEDIFITNKEPVLQKEVKKNKGFFAKIFKK
ncbi:YueI family protein [Neobacillus sp. OS1-33]|uniref:YueI family protein n=1 Tax=Neobacillus sp. OS1-33 TaxID=3070683 RepID=UPI0027E11CE7|nr:YueI family protein [Neobacillus sp. OS1-33]WML24042.1 YueI family protein [Neobacillus sp. OS1-33]